jgi:hypothetical protein
MSRFFLLFLISLALSCSGDDDSGSGYSEAELDWIRAGGAPESRSEVIECDSYREAGPVWDADGDGQLDTEDYEEADCLSDAECTDGLNGRCIGDEWGYQVYCSYDQCLTDEDCDNGAVCACGGDEDRNVCMSSSCTINSDCAEGELCVQDTFACHDSGWHCMAPDAACLSDSDCPDEEGASAPLGMGDCTYSDGAWECAFNYCDD